MLETSSLRRYVRNKKIFIPALLGVFLCFFALLALTGFVDIIFALAVNEVAGYLVDNDSFGEMEFTVEDDWPGEGAAEISVSPGLFEETGSEWPPVDIAAVAPGEEAAEEAGLADALDMMAEAEMNLRIAREIELALAGGVAPEVEAAEADSARKVEMEGGRTRGRVYTASYLRDPFYSLVKADRAMPNKLLDISRAKMVGSVWGEKSIIALLEDDAGRSYALKAGDKIVDGKVVSVSPASVTFSVTVFGMTKNVTLELAEEGEW